MLSGLLEKQQCAECRFCCVFDKEDFWEMPTLSKATAERILEVKPETKLEESQGEYVFSKSNLTAETYPCPALTDTGCSLSNELKPFECSIWPFRVMLVDGELALTVCKDCNGLEGIPEIIVDIFGNANVRPLAFKYAKEHPQIVKPYHTNYRIIEE
jgi:hypothetical protein